MKNVKRILTLLLVAVMVLSLVACGEAKKSGTGAVIGEGTVQLPEGFTAGYGRADISPTTLPVATDTQTANVVHDKLYATCIAVSDGTDIALLFSMDMKNIPSEDFYPEATKRITAAYGIPKENVVLNAMHSHNAPAAQSPKKAGVIEWREVAYQGILEAAKIAMEDLAPATAYTGRSDTTDMVYVRRYLDVQTGRCLNMNETVSKGLCVRETEADPEMRTIRFDRGEKKDIVMVNWQAHAASAATPLAGQISADYVGVTRAGVESVVDAHFAFFMGASGNIALKDKLGGASLAWDELGANLVGKVQEALAAETPIEVGTDVKISHTVIEGKVIKETPDRILAAQRYSAAATAAEKEQIIAECNLDTEHDVTAIQYREKYLLKNGETYSIPLTAVSFGEIAFATAPYEMFDTNGLDIRNGVPFKTTFVCSLTNGNLGYFPDSDIWDNKGYEVVAARFEKGHAELCADTLIDMLKAQAG